MKMIHSTQLLCAATALFFAGSALAAPHPLSGTIAASDDWRIPKSNYGKGPAIQCASKNNPGYLASGTGDSYVSPFQLAGCHVLIVRAAFVLLNHPALTRLPSVACAVSGEFGKFSDQRAGLTNHQLRKCLAMQCR